MRQIKGAAIKAEQMGCGFRAFWTFTVRAEDRALFTTGGVALGREMRRVLNALNEWFRRRGMHGLQYVWVAENVRNENPHVHLLTNLTVRREEFAALAAHVEGLWGHGWVKIERVRSTAEASRYIMKAVRYTLKAERADQGVVIGSRYGISRRIMPRYETVDLWGCAEASRELLRLSSRLTEDIQEIGDGAWLTPFGVAFRAGTDMERVPEMMERLEGRPHEP